MSLIVQCPSCNKDVPWTDASLYRPFCTKRCQLIDLGEWAAEEKAIPCGADVNAESPASKAIDIEEVEAMLAQQGEDFFKS